MLFNATKKLNKVFFISVLAFSSVTALNAEEFRVRKAIEVNIPEKDEKITCSMGPSDALILVLPKDKTYIQGVELSFKVPAVVAEWRDSVAWSLYNGIKPEPSSGKIDYSGTRIKVGTFGSSLSLNIQIPLYKTNTIKKTPYSVYVEEIPEIQNDKIFFRLQLAMKGASDEIPYSKFEVSLRPILINKGKLSVTCQSPETTEIKPFTVFVDGKNVSDVQKGVLLDTGSHTVSVVSDYYRNEVRTINVEQAKTTSLQISLRDITPTLTITAPKGTVVLLDDMQTEILEDAIKITSGEHTIRFKVGDYELVKAIKAENGKSYSVSFKMDASVSESD